MRAWVGGCVCVCVVSACVCAWVGACVCVTRSCQFTDEEVLFIV